MHELRRLTAGVTRVGLLAASAGFASLLHADSATGAADAPLVDTVASACVANIVIAVACLFWAVLSRLFDILFVKGGYIARQERSRITLTPHHHRPNNKDEAVTVTPAMLWYYVYTVGLAVFALSYTLQCTTLLPSLVLAMSTVVTATCFYVWDMGWPPRSPTHYLVHTSCLVVAAVCLGVIAADGEWGPSEPRKGLAGLWDEAWNNGWLGTALPLIAPPTLGAFRHSLGAIHLSSDKLVVFALPFVTAISVCYISMYVPLVHAASMRLVVDASSNASSSSAAPAAGCGAANFSLVAHEIEADVDQLVADAMRGVAIERPLVWVAFLAAQGGALLTFISGANRPTVMPSAAVAYAAVLACRRAAVAQTPSALRCAIVCGITCVIATLQYCVDTAEPPPQCAQVAQQHLDENGDPEPLYRRALGMSSSAAGGLQRCCARSRSTYNECTGDDSDMEAPGGHLHHPSAGGSYRSAFSIDDCDDTQPALPPAQTDEMAILLSDAPPPPADDAHPAVSA